MWARWRLTSVGPCTPAMVSRSTTGRSSSSASAESMQLSMAPVSTSAGKMLDGSSGRTPAPGTCAGSEPICTPSVGPIRASTSGSPVSPQSVLATDRPVHHRRRQSQRRCSHSTDEVRATPKASDSVGSGILEVLVGAHQYLIMHDHPLAGVICFEFVAQAVVCSNLLRECGHCSCSLGSPRVRDSGWRVSPLTLRPPASLYLTTQRTARLAHPLSLLHSMQRPWAASPRGGCRLAV